MIRIFPIIPFDPGTAVAASRNLGRAYNDQIRHLPDDCWISVQDYDVMWPQVSIPSMKIMHMYIEAYPDTGLFTSYASRTRNPAQKYREGVFEDIDSMRFWQKEAQLLVDNHCTNLDYEDIPHEISGFHMLFPKSAWKASPFKEGIGLLRVDNEFTWDIHRQRKPVRLMKALLCLHFYRLHTHILDTKHLVG